MFSVTNQLAVRVLLRDLMIVRSYIYERSPPGALGSFNRPRRPLFIYYCTGVKLQVFSKTGGDGYVTLF